MLFWFLIKTFVIGGILSVIVAWIGYEVFDGLVGIRSLSNDDLAKFNPKKQFGYCIWIGFIEEFGKVLICVILAKKHPKYPESINTYTYAMFVSLGFQSYEDIWYGMSRGITVSILRNLTPFHLIFSAIWGKGLATIHDEKASFADYVSLPLFIIVASIVHAYYDFLIFSGNGWYSLLFIFVVFLFNYKFLSRPKAMC